MSSTAPKPAKPKGDPILRIMELYNQDARAGKIDLSVGVYKDELGRTPVLASVKAAERRLIESEDSKSYLGLAGNTGFSAALAAEVFGSDLAQGGHLAALQSVGGSGGLRLCFEYAMQCAGAKRLHVATPTWENQAGIGQATGLQIARYPYFDRTSGLVDFDGMLAALNALGPQDAVLLHGCCHNPTGADLSVEQWEQLAASASVRGWLPLIDLAYAGFGAGIEQDTAGLRALLKQLPMALVAVSCSKIFGLYRERVGAAYIVAQTPEDGEIAEAELKRIAREIYSMPPDHGAAVVRLILTDAGLKTQWVAELAAMRDRINSVRSLLAAELNQLDNSERFSALAHQRGMFSLLPLSVEQVSRLREEQAVYVIEDGRTNVAGVTSDNAATVAKALFAVL